MNIELTPALSWTPQVGDRVVVRDPNAFLAVVRNKVQDGRVGELVRFHEGEVDYAAVRFPAQGRRKEFRHSFRVRNLAQAPT